MKYFSALADAEFARAAFAAAGLDFDALKNAKDADCLKNALAAAKTNSEAESILAKAKQENDELSAKVAALEKAKAVSAVTIDALSSAVTGTTGAAAKISEDGKLTNADEIATARKSAVTKAARDMVARAGHPGLLDDPALDPLKQQKVEKNDGPQLTGRERLAVAFQKEIAAQAKRRGSN